MVATPVNTTKTAMRCDLVTAPAIWRANVPPS